MSTNNYLLPAQLYDYLLDVSLREPAVLRRLREETAALPSGSWQIPPELGQLLRFLVALTGARNAIELGTFTGYSALCIAQALPADGRLIACDANEEAHAIARRYWAEAGVADRIELRVGQVADTLGELIGEGRAGAFDFAFIDADKPGYADYYESCLTLVRPGGLVVFDNVFMGGAVAEPAPSRKYADAMKNFNRMIAGDERVTITMLPVADGVTLARIRP